MKYNIKGTDVAVTDEIRDYLEKKLYSLDKLVPDAADIRADVELQFLRDEARMYRAEVTLHDIRLKAPFFAEVRGGSLHEAIDAMAHELSGELTRAKKRRMHEVRRGAAAIKDFVRGFTDRF